MPISQQLVSISYGVYMYVRGLASFSCPFQHTNSSYTSPFPLLSPFPSLLPLSSPSLLKSCPLLFLHPSPPPPPSPYSYNHHTFIITGSAVSPQGVQPPRPRSDPRPPSLLRRQGLPQEDSHQSSRHSTRHKAAGTQVS